MASKRQKGKKEEKKKRTALVKEEGRNEGRKDTRKTRCDDTALVSSDKL